ncbi:hypothetical protein C8R43DRAFT_952262 [Mycena crocata]|nr:hypothetical protein C8R43DRAFT_952262 [Mycena crocata]
MAIVADSVDQSLAIAALPDSTGIYRTATRHTEAARHAEAADHRNFSAKAVRQHGRLSTVMLNRNDPTQAAITPSESLRETLVKKLAAAVPTSDSPNRRDPYVRNAETFGRVSGVPPSVPLQNKTTVQNVAAALNAGRDVFGVKTFSDAIDTMKTQLGLEEEQKVHIVARNGLTRARQNYVKMVESKGSWVYACASHEAASAYLRKSNFICNVT